MGKRKFKKPDDSESDYEWEEAKPKKSNFSERNDTKGNDLEEFLNQYTTKSNNEIRSENIQSEKDKQEKLFEDRLYKPTEARAQKYDTQWLKKSYYRCKEQANNEGVDIVSLLRDRYDDETVDFMMRAFNGHYENRNNRNFDKKRYNEKPNRSDYRDNSRDEIRKTSPPKQYGNPSHNDCIDSDTLVEIRYVTEADINEACSNLFKAELSGRQSKVAKLRKRVEILREAQNKNLKIKLTKPNKADYNKEVMIQKSFKSGKMLPYIESGNKFVSQSRPYDSVDGSIDQLIREEKVIDSAENNWAFAKLSGKTQFGVKTVEDMGECEYNDTFVHKVDKEKLLKKEKQKTIKVQKHRTAQVDNCKLCYKKLPKHLVLAKGCYHCLVVPVDLGITDYHLQLLPIDHIAASTHLTNDDSWTELNQFKRRIVEFFEKQLHAETVFMETIIRLERYPHMVIDCIPLRRDRHSCDLSTSIFFKKSIDDAKSEWCQNKKLIDLKDGDIRRTVPKEFPYFAVQFDDLRTGYTFVIENEEEFSDRFGLEIVGSLLDKNLIEINDRKAKSFNQQADTVLKYEKKWRPFNLWNFEDSDSD